jgi:hypothetical protein
MNNDNHNIPKDERVCILCGQSIGDEFHLLFVCCNEYLVNLRRIYLPRYYVTYPSIVKMNGLGILYHRPVSIGIRKFDALNFVIQILVFSFKVMQSPARIISSGLIM